MLMLQGSHWDTTLDKKHRRKTVRQTGTTVVSRTIRGPVIQSWKGRPHCHRCTSGCFLDLGAQSHAGSSQIQLMMGWGGRGGGGGPTLQDLFVCQETQLALLCYASLLTLARAMSSPSRSRPSIRTGAPVTRPSASARLTVRSPSLHPRSNATMGAQPLTPPPTPPPTAAAPARPVRERHSKHGDQSNHG